MGTRRNCISYHNLYWLYQQLLESSHLYHFQSRVPKSIQEDFGFRTLNINLNILHLVNNNQQKLYCSLFKQVHLIRQWPIKILQRLVTKPIFTLIVNYLCNSQFHIIKAQQEDFWFQFYIVRTQYKGFWLSKIDQKISCANDIIEQTDIDVL